MKTRRLTAVGPDGQVYTRPLPALTDLDRRRRLRRMRTTLKRPGVWVTGPLTRRKLYPPTTERSTH